MQIARRPQRAGARDPAGVTARSLAFAAIVVTTACAARPVTEPPEPAAVPSASPEPPAPVIAAEHSAIVFEARAIGFVM